MRSCEWGHDLSRAWIVLFTITRFGSCISWLHYSYTIPLPSTLIFIFAINHLLINPILSLWLAPGLPPVSPRGEPVSANQPDGRRQLLLINPIPLHHRIRCRLRAPLACARL